MKRLNTAEMIALILVIVGGLNWGLVGAFKFNLVDELFGAGSALARIVYVIVGLATLYVIISFLPRSRDD
jgi:uncharacterized membrane protein YuzA (DUF378 family)